MVLSERSVLKMETVPLPISSNAFYFGAIKTSDDDFITAVKKHIHSQGAMEEGRSN